MVTALPQVHATQLFIVMCQNCGLYYGTSMATFNMHCVPFLAKACHIFFLFFLFLFVSDDPSFCGRGVMTAVRDPNSTHWNDVCVCGGAETGMMQSSACMNTGAAC